MRQLRRRTPVTDDRPAARRVPVLVLVLVFEGVDGLGVSAVADVLSGANARAPQGFRYDVRTVSPDGAAVRTSSGLRMLPDHGPGGVTGVDTVDTLVVPGADGIPATGPETVRALLRAADGARRVASVGTGAFLLAEAGLLHGRTAATHWAFAEELAHRFPDITVDPRHTVVKDDRVTTAGGGGSALDLALSLVREDLGHEVARRTAASLATSPRTPGGQAQFAEPRVREARNPALRAVQRQVLDDPGGDWSLPSFARRAGLSERQISRLFRAQAGMTAREYVERVRVSFASRRLLETARSPEAVARESGFGTEAAMRGSFLRVLQVSPVEFRNRFS
ncbi:DJ-1/PfpI family protein [Streptomyces sp. JV176]|uniref:GlxA family transcriptional regulator n=1 Tax=Streptomyces sp. JV176 TaxID=858630 RepID=UPI002E7795E8|nr:DJ-1/PfpI family protein [Streptomyces sp. JV176]MEE1798978.1 DJ-1/PfpI family protein [Streptomyces sp. JV176]